MRAPPVPLPLFVAALGLGCARPDYHEVRAACGLQPGEHAIIELSDPEDWEPLPRTCTAALGEAVGFDWESFGEEGPRAIVAEDFEWPVGSMIAGLAMIAAADFGPASQLSRRDIPPPAYAALRRVQPLRGAEADLGELLFTAIQASIRVVRFNEDALTGRSGGHAFHSPDHRLLVTRPRFDNSTAAIGASMYIHESLHREVRHDLDCVDLYANTEYGLYHPEHDNVMGSCDYDVNKVNGSTAWLLDILYNWLLTQPPELADPESGYGALDKVEFERSTACNLICDLSGFKPCADTYQHNASRGKLCTLNEGYFGGAD